MEIKLSRAQCLFGLSVIILIILLRAISLDVVDLIDPTESRYAWIAQEMVVSGNWLTPQLPSEGGITPYLGKPPLHFWLTAISYKLLGMHECTSRLPSFFSYFLIAIFTGIFANRFYGKKVAILSRVIVLSSGLLFFLSGSSGVDVTLSAMITGALVSFALHVAAPTSQIAWRWGILFFFMTALSVMTKGPVGTILIGFPILGWLIFERKLRVLKTIPWISGTVVFLAITVPWFALQELSYPGFLKYFFINENFGRFLFSDYGDRYGTGHTYFRGSSWWMLLAAFFPWSALWAVTIIGSPKDTLAIFKSKDPWRNYALFWGLSAAVFFTFARQLLAAYMLPSIGGLAIITSLLICNLSISPFKHVLDRFLLAASFFSVLFGLAGITTGMILGTENHYIFLSILFLISMVVFLHFARNTAFDSFEWSIVNSGFIACAFTICIFSAGTYASTRKSTEEILLELTRNVRGKSPTVGIVHDNAYSAYFYGRSWQGQLSKPVNIIYTNPLDPRHQGPKEIIAKTTKVNEFTAPFFAHYKSVKTIGNWSWFERMNKTKCLTHVSDVAIEEKI